MRLFDETTLRRLEQLALVADQVRVGRMKGNRRSRKRGASIEFADYRNYSQGDDLRRLDWNIFARLGQPLIKLTEEEEDLAVHLLVDTSSSMDWPPEPDGDRGGNKLLYALRLAGGLGHLALSSGDQLAVTLFDATSARSWGPFRGGQNSYRLLAFLEAHYDRLAAWKGSPRHTALDPALRDYALRAARPGLSFVLTDLLAPGSGRAGLHALSSRGYEPALIHLLSPDEAQPELTGDLKLVDAETGETIEVSIDPAAVESYLERLKAMRDEMGTFCRSRAIHYVPVVTSTPWDDLILRTLRERSVVA
jgi:uncharacterized protein (DUF58 family)